MKLIPILIALSLFSLFAIGQDRQTALAEFNSMKARAAELDRIILAPDESDLAEAARRSATAIRLLPREKYDNSFTSIRGGGAYYGFYYRDSHYGYGSELGWEQGHLSTGFNDLALMADLGAVPIDQITLESRGVIDLANYRLPADPRSSTDSMKARGGELKVGETPILNRVKPASGRSYVLRSVRVDYYDILVAFSVHREDDDKSLILFWKLLHQFDTPRRASDSKPAVTDAQLISSVKGHLIHEPFKNVTFSVSNKVLTLSGSFDRQKLGYLTNLIGLSGTSKVVNNLELR